METMRRYLPIILNLVYVIATDTYTYVPFSGGSGQFAAVDKSHGQACSGFSKPVDKCSPCK